MSIFILIGALFAQNALAQETLFSPDLIVRELNRSLINDLSLKSSNSKYRKINMLFKTHETLRLACSLEIKSQSTPSNCYNLISIWEQTLHKSGTSLRKNLRIQQQREEKRIDIQKYIRSRQNE